MSEPWIILETSGRGGAVGLALEGRIVGEAALDPARRHNRDLAPAVAELLSAHSLTPRQVFGVMVGVGPGSYTGLRVGIMSAKALAWATGCRLVAVPTFHAIAEQSPPPANAVEVISDALQGLVYVQRFRGDGGKWEPANELKIELASTWAQQLGEGACVSGPGVAVYHAMIPPTVLRVGVEHRTPAISAMFRVGLRFPAVSESELMQLEPLYLRGSSAEEKAKT